MKRYAVILIALAGMLCIGIGCESLITEQVCFQNNSTSKTVYPVWDGVNMGSLAPGETSEVRTVNPGTHTFQWINASNNEPLTTMSWPNMVAGKYLTYPYSD